MRRDELLNMWCVWNNRVYGPGQPTHDKEYKKWRLAWSALFDAAMYDAAMSNPPRDATVLGDTSDSSSNSTTQAVTGGQELPPYGPHRAWQ